MAQHVPAMLFASGWISTALSILSPSLSLGARCPTVAGLPFSRQTTRPRRPDRGLRRSAGSPAGAHRTPLLSHRAKGDSHIRRPPAGIPHGCFERECFCQFRSDGILLWSKFTRQRGHYRGRLGPIGLPATSAAVGGGRRGLRSYIDTCPR
jgi:hypothetical protein